MAERRGTRKRRSEKHPGKITGILCSMILGAVVGYNIARLMDAGAAGGGLSAGELAVRAVWVAVSFCFGFFLQTILHETGHMICGMMSGYRFSSLRIGSFMWMKQDGKIRFRRYSLAGTGGQCLMGPPDFRDGKIPYIFYNLGGVLMNIFAAAAVFVLWLFWAGNWYVSCFLIILCLSGIWLALVNGIPLKLELLNNDGRNIVDIGKSRNEMYAFWLQLKVAESQSGNIRLRDMPAEWFEMPEKEELRQSMSAVRGVFRANRLLDEHAFDETAELIGRLLNMDSAIIGVYRALLAADRVYCELIGECKEEVLKIWDDRRQKQVMKQMRNEISVMRTEYAYALLHDRDEKKAEAIRKKFEKRLETYPYHGDAESEKELLEITEREWKNRKQAEEEREIPSERAENEDGNR